MLRVCQGALKGSKGLRCGCRSASASATLKTDLIKGCRGGLRDESLLIKSHETFPYVRFGPKLFLVLREYILLLRVCD